MAIATKRRPPKIRERKFKVVAGVHYHGGKQWMKDEVLASTLPLDKMFKGKFEVVSNEVPANEGHDEIRYVRDGMSDSINDQLPKRRQMSTNPEFNMEEELDTADEGTAAVEEEDVLQPKKKKKKKAQDNSDFLDGATNVTDNFPFVQEESSGLIVLRNGKQYGVVDEDDPDTLLNKKPLLKSEVDSFVEEYLDG